MFEQDGFHIIVVTSVLPLGRFLASMFFILSCFLPFSLILHMTISKTHLAYPIVSFTMIFLLSSDPLLPPLANLGRGHGSGGHWISVLVAPFVSTHWRV